MTILRRQPFLVYMFNKEGKGFVFASFTTLREAESFCQDWQKKDPAHLYIVSEDPL